MAIDAVSRVRIEMHRAIKPVLCIVLGFALGLPGELKAQAPSSALLDSIAEACRTANSNALIVYHRGNLVYEDYFGNPVQKIEAMSATKSVVSLAVGMLLERGFLDSLDQPVHSVYPEWNQGEKKLITIRHLLEHTSGIQNVANAGAEVETAPDAVQLALSASLEDHPGDRFSYNNKACNLLAGIVQRTSGYALDAFLDEFLFTPLGISDFAWRNDPSGNPYGMAGLTIYPDDLAKIGLLMQGGGKWEGRQIIGEEWVNAMIRPGTKNENYGLQWWLTYEKASFNFGDAFFENIEDRTDSTTLDLLKKLRGTYRDMGDIREKAMGIFNRGELMALGKLLQSVPPSLFVMKNEGEVLAYSAKGYLGQYLIVVPQREIVLVRMITAENYRAAPNKSALPLLVQWAIQL